MNDCFFELNEKEKKELGEFKALKYQSKLHYLQGYILELENKVNLLIDKNNEYKKITSGIAAIPHENERAGYILIADKRYFDEGLFITNYIEDKKIKNLIKELKEESRQSKYWGREKIKPENIYKTIIIDLENILKEAKFEKN